MAVINFLVLTEAERNAAAAHDHPELQLGGRPVDGASPGIGINLNDNASAFGPGEPVALAGKYVVSKVILDNAEYNAVVPLMIEELADKPYCLLEAESIFAPQEV